MSKEKIINTLMFFVGTKHEIKKNGKRILSRDAERAYDQAEKLAEEMLRYEAHEGWEYVKKMQTFTPIFTQ